MRDSSIARWLHACALTATSRRTLTVNASRSLPTISELGWARKGYTFGGWNGYLADWGYTVKLEDGESIINLTITPNAPLYFYANWQKVLTWQELLPQLLTAAS